ncbi:MAG: triose-phosphate isomerase [archaeon]
MIFEKPLIIVNYKLYAEATGSKALEFTRRLEKAITDKAVIIITPQTIDLKELKEKSSLTVFSQNVNGVSYGKGTGKMLPESLKMTGIKGSLINHAENPLSLNEIELIVKKFKELSLTSIVCVNDLESAKKIAVFEPDYIAYEPPELIGSTTNSVADSKPEVMETTIKAVKEISPETEVLAGAGVKSSQDMKVTLQLGGKGCLLATAVMKSENPEKALQEIINGID